MSAIKVPSEVSKAVAVTLGVVGGGYIAKVAAEHLFVRGTTTEERRTMMLVSSAALAAFAAHQFFGIDERWFSVEKLAENPPDLTNLTAKLGK